MLKCPKIVTGKSPFAPISICSGNSERNKKANTVTETHTKKLMNKRNKRIAT